MSTPSVYQRVPLRDVWPELGGGDIRRGRGQAFWRDSHDWNVSVDLDRDLFFDHVGGGPVTLAMTALDCSAREAGRWLREHFGHEQPARRSNSHRVAYRAPDGDEIAEAEAVRIALVWHIESQLELVKMMLYGPCHYRAVLRCRRLTRQLQRVRAWTPRQAVLTLRRLSCCRPDFVNWLRSEFEDFGIALARGIAEAAA
jgi:hypothetical protein